MNSSFSPISSVTQRSIADTVSIVLTGTRVSFSEFKAIAATEFSELSNIFIHEKTKSRMDYTKLAENIKQHIAPNPSDHAPYLDLLSVCRQLEHDDFTMAHALKKIDANRAPQRVFPPRGPISEMVIGRVSYRIVRQRALVFC